MYFFKLKVFTLFAIIITQFTLFFQQYFNYTPTWNNQFLEASSFEGFLNGFFVVPNTLLYWLSHNFDWETQFYIFDYLNPNVHYINGFASGVSFSVLLLILTNMCKFNNDYY